MKIKNVEIGDRFMTHGKFKREATVIDIYTVTNSQGELVRHECIATYKLGNQDMKYQEAFATVVMNKLTKQHEPTKDSRVNQ